MAMRELEIPVLGPLMNRLFWVLYNVCCWDLYWIDEAMTA